VIVSPIVSSRLPRARLHVNARTQTMRRDMRQAPDVPDATEGSDADDTWPHPQERHARRFQPHAIRTRRSRNTRNPRTHRPRQMAGMGTPRLPHRKTPTMERTRRPRMDKPASRVTRKIRPSPWIIGRGSLRLLPAFSYFFAGLLHSAYSSSSTAIARVAADGTR
jgi:hypothetical protein